MVYAHYDREVDIVWFRFEERDSMIDRSDEMEWGLLDRDDHGEVVGIELWRASERLPRPLLDALPEPSEEELTTR